MFGKAAAIALLVLCIEAEYSSAADIYKRTRPDGTVEYSDKEHAKQGAELYFQTPEDLYEAVLIVRDRPADEVYGTKPEFNIAPPWLWNIPATRRYDIE